jgi:ParB-like chromosome segregation protein Spo0J
VLLKDIEVVSFFSSLCHHLNVGLQQENPNQVRAMQSADDPEFLLLCQRVAKGYDQSKPIVVVQQGSKWYVCDSHHRVLAARRAGLVAIPATVYFK